MLGSQLPSERKLPGSPLPGELPSDSRLLGGLGRSLGSQSPSESELLGSVLPGEC